MAHEKQTAAQDVLQWEQRPVHTAATARKGAKG